MISQSVEVLRTIGEIREISVYNVGLDHFPRFTG
jgi:hypothetical protein